MTMKHNRLLVSIVVLVLWAAATMFGAQVLAGGEEISLDSLVQRGIGWQFVAAIAILLGAIALFRWRDIGFTAPHDLLRILWFPGLYLVVFAALIVLFGLPPARVAGLVFVNTMMVGFSEEVMFRGVLLRASLERMSMWAAIGLNMALFGGVHAFNGFITGDFGAAALQSLAAAMSGLVFIAIVLRTGSIWPAIVYHGLWDCALFLIGLAANGSGGGESAGGAAGQLPAYGALLPMALVLPNFLFALFVLRKVGGKAKAA